MNEADRMLKEWRRNTHLTGIGVALLVIIVSLVFFRADAAPIVFAALIGGAWWVCQAEAAHRRLYQKFGGKDDATSKVRESIKCPPEHIRPSVKKGYCGVTGCGIKTPHSHVDDLSRRLRGR